LTAQRERKREKDRQTDRQTTRDNLKQTVRSVRAGFIDIYIITLHAKTERRVKKETIYRQKLTTMHIVMFLLLSLLLKQST
jgi:hypothetical protein